MELVRRMKTVRSALVLGLAAGLTVAAGLVPLSSSAQQGERTIATGSNIPLTADAPDEYVVKPGDTLWDISKVFLRDPWYWPEIWYVNPQVANPHLIYPGDVLQLIYVDGKPQVTLARGPQSGSGTKRLSPQVRTQPRSRASPAVPRVATARSLGGRPVPESERVSKAP